MNALNVIQEKNWEHACRVNRGRLGYVPFYVHSVVETTGWRGSPRTPFERQSFTGADLEAYRAKQGHQVHVRPCFD